MREYEVTVILKPQLEDEVRTTLINQVTEWLAPGVEDAAAKPQLDDWGTRKMAYPIRDFKEGRYLLFKGQIDPTGMKEIERKFQFAEDILRYMIVRVES